MDQEDPINQFFPGEESVDLYAVLSLSSDSSFEDIRKSYRKLALLCHPDKQTNSTDADRASASVQFQKIGFAYAVLSDEKRRKRYDKTGRTDEGLGIEADEDGGWEAYFEDLFDRVTRGKLDEMKKEYQGTSEEVDDLKAAYTLTKGSLGEIMTHIPHSTMDDEPRFIIALSDLIAKGELPILPLWESSSKDEKARLVRKKQGDREAKEAEKLAKELGVWDEFYGSGKTGARKGKGKGKETDAQEEDGEDHSALQALILRRKKDRSGFFDNLAAKYTKMETGPTKKAAKGKKRGKAVDESDVEDMESPKKKPKTSALEPPEIDDEDFAKLQQKLFGNKASSTSTAASPKGKRTSRGRKAK
ncbi:DnaJ-domain-containing protein [Leucogyrophana mollusca]|uniref:DnaJ-domain-containing protein n=1 Tax=Leucogyrophana mollusca TaxID=85980 RepID=A0ACB8BYM7_9AGAM|nr:DnaJ-domain-containing protein [Leucogyrophana mollusca]